MVGTSGPVEKFDTGFWHTIYQIVVQCLLPYLWIESIVNNAKHLCNLTLKRAKPQRDIRKLIYFYFPSYWDTNNTT